MTGVGDTGAEPTPAPGQTGRAPLRVVLAGGGTAGHIEPALALADALRRNDPHTQITMLGTTRGLETRLVPARGYELALIPAVPVPRRPSTQILTVPSRLRRAVVAVTRILVERRADVRLQGQVLERFQTGNAARLPAAAFETLSLIHI